MVKDEKEIKKTGLEMLREPFETHLISKLPKPTKKQTEEVKRDFKQGIRCGICGLWHHPKVVHLDYVGHAALTDRLLDCDIHWSWKPLASDSVGLPAIDGIDGLWIELTVCGQTRIGYGSPDGKKGGNAVKESIGDALRNAAMRFGAALDLWHKGDLHIEDAEVKKSEHKNEDVKQVISDDKIEKEKAILDGIEGFLMSVNSIEALNDYKNKLRVDLKHESKAFMTKVGTVLGKHELDLKGE